MAAMLVGLLLVDPWLKEAHGIAWAPIFFVLLGGSTMLCVYEMSRMLGRLGWRVYELPALAAVILILSLGAVSHVTGVRLLWDIGPMVIGPPTLVVMLLMVTVLSAEALRMFRAKAIGPAIESAGGALLTVGYIGLLPVFIIAMRFLDQPTGLAAIGVWLASAKCGDMGAYFAGSWWGRTKLIPRLSPGKTVEGCIGGLAFGMFGAVVVGLPAMGLPWWQLALLGAAIAAAGMIGDLVESLLKRAAGVKDSSDMVRGFGGMLDIMDSLLMTAPVAYGMLLLFGAR